MTPRPDLATELTDLPEGRDRFAWPEHEYVRGWGIFGLPFDSGHVLALRVFPQNDFAPYRTVWHRTPDAAWSIFVDGPRLDTACPRYYGPACALVTHARIDLQWLAPAALRITMDDPALSWSVVASTTPLLRLLNVVSPRLPLWTWQRPTLVRARELIAHRLLGVGATRMHGVMPSGHRGTLMPERMYFINDATATLDGIDLGTPALAATTPDIGGVTLPARGVLAVGQAAWRILDPAEYQRTRAETAGAARSAGERGGTP
jgi:hypothetical protein